METVADLHRRFDSGRGVDVALFLFAGRLARFLILLLVFFASPIGSPQLQLWLIEIEIESGKIVETLNLPQGRVSSVRFSPNSNSIALPGTGKIHLLDVADLVASS